jgi:hypothetical protein
MRTRIYFIFIFATTLIGAGIIFFVTLENEVQAPIITDNIVKDGDLNNRDIVGDQPKEVQPDYTKPVLIEVPFTSQAPSGQWHDQRFQDGCEEASVIMAINWVKGLSLDKVQAEKQILELTEYQDQNFNGYIDISVQDLTKLIKDYYGYGLVRHESDINTDDIIKELYKGNIVLVPLNGQSLGNPNFTPPGPERHMAVVIGYNPETEEFVFNDPGTRKGQGYHYSHDIIEKSLRAYPSGNHAPILTNEKTMIVVAKSASTF